MSFFGKFKTGSNNADSATKSAPAKRDPNAPQPTPLEKHLADVTGPVRPDGSDKFFGMENYGSTCYCNSIIQCLYYSAPFRENVINFPSQEVVREIHGKDPNGAPTSPRATSTTPYPNPTSPARKPPPNAPGSPGAGAMQKPDDNKNVPEERKRSALVQGPVLDMQYDNSLKYGMEESLFTSLRDIFEAIIQHKSRIGVVSPHRFLEILRRENEMFRTAMHQDAHEFLNLLLNQVVDNVELFAKQRPELAAHMNGAAPEKARVDISVDTRGLNMPKAGLDTRWVHDLFEGLLTSETRCLTCENTSQRDEAFLDLSVDLSAHTSVTSCLRKFSEEEMLCERNKFHCDNCGGLQEAEKRMKIKRLPRILALHLKRFKYTEDLQRLQKLFHRVVYPFHLRLFNTTDDAEDPDRLYELYAVVVHIGGGPYHGHYVSIIKTQDRGWLLFDDELVEPVSKDYVMNFFGGEPGPGVQDAKQLACAYVLFYQETTLEAVLREQDAELGANQTTPVRVSDVETSKDNLSQNKIAGILSHAPTLQTPIVEDMEHMDPLVHAVTSPIIGNIPEKTPMVPIMPPKTKKELKQEEKEAKVAKKAQFKAEEDERIAQSRKRVENRKKQQDEIAAVLEMSKQTAAEEAESRGEPLPKQGGLSRWRTGSMSLKVKPSKSLFGKDKDKKEEKLPPVPQNTNGTSSTPVGPPAATPAATDGAAESNGYASITALPQPVQEVKKEEEKVKKNRFSLGRKRSTMMN
ncbi:hypothetical protein DOTSEDRAFT_75790 [Dothistroma septosporum NZE10]|uniref:Ubiquitin carboxyl-terminal hydrolase n=1 Tax=Dothistroma septosporum (strain NZE10 / CBS 128990) TaxID=675120 RepID=N1PDT0_DOTSN|nr:hypothetical protein DOTSEDRAFT_75790 [Dothistroma septosporum NZE10]